MKDREISKANGNQDLNKSEVQVTDHLATGGICALGLAVFAAGGARTMAKY